MDKQPSPLSPPQSSVACFMQETQSALIQNTWPQFQPMQELLALQKEQRHRPNSWEIAVSYAITARLSQYLLEMTPVKAADWAGQAG